MSLLHFAIWVLQAFGFFMCAESSNVSSSSPTAELGGTLFVGKSANNKVDFFGGIPFAEPPVGNRRLKAPVLKSFNLKDETFAPDVFNSQAFGPSCVQSMLPPDEVSEDCLLLNIYRPSMTVIKRNDTVRRLLPVMVWFYGGGWIVGSSSMYDGVPLVTRSVERNTPIILVTVNYRLGPLGFPRGDDAAREAEAGSRLLNLGMLDNIAALQWVQENIQAFGGDPVKVTAFGESAGARTLELLILSGNIHGLARGVIMESTVRIPPISPSSTTANQIWDNFVSVIPSCQSLVNDSNPAQSTVDCIRNSSTTELIEAYNTADISFTTARLNWPPVFDGEKGLVPRLPSTLDPAHGVVDGVIIGVNLDEGTLSTPQTVNSSQSIRDMILSSPPYPPDASTSERQMQLEELERIAEEVLRLYPNDPSLGSPFGTGNDTFGLDPEYKRLAAISTDMRFHAERRYHINQQLLKANIKTYSYIFTDPDAVPVQDFVTTDPEPIPGSLGVTHSSEIFYVFGTLGMRPEVSNVTPTAAKLSEAMMDYWISFADGLDPNDGQGSTRPSWPAYTSDNQILIQLNGHNTTVIPDDFRKEQIQIFNHHIRVFGE